MGLALLFPSFPQAHRDARRAPAPAGPPPARGRRGGKRPRSLRTRWTCQILARCLGATGWKRPSLLRTRRTGRRRRCGGRATETSRSLPWPSCPRRRASSRWRLRRADRSGPVAIPVRSGEHGAPRRRLGPRLRGGDGVDRLLRCVERGEGAGVPAGWRVRDGCAPQPPLAVMPAQAGIQSLAAAPGRPERAGSHPCALRRTRRASAPTGPPPARGRRGVRQSAAPRATGAPLARVTAAERGAESDWAPACAGATGCGGALAPRAGPQPGVRAWTVRPATANRPPPRWCSVCRSRASSDGRGSQRPWAKARASAAAATTSAKQVS